MPQKSAGLAGRTILIVQQQLPLRLTRRPLPESSDAAPGAATSAWTVEWDDEALLNPRATLAAHEAALASGKGTTALAAASIKWIGAPPVDVPASDEEVRPRARGASSSSRTRTRAVVAHARNLGTHAHNRTRTRAPAGRHAAPRAARLHPRLPAACDGARVPRRLLQGHALPCLPQRRRRASRARARVASARAHTRAQHAASAHERAARLTPDTSRPQVYGEVPTRWWLKARQSDRWKAYMDANGKFATAVVESYHEGDLVWVLDYHLLLVPAALARRHIAPVLLFMHVPFPSCVGSLRSAHYTQRTPPHTRSPPPPPNAPSSEIFRSLSVRDELLRGMLSADIIGFHLFEYARHFLTCCRRILGLTHTARRCGRLTLDYNGREVAVTVSHVGVEPPFLLGRFRSAPAVVETAAGWRARFAGARIVAGIDTVERLKGVPLKLTAFEALLSANADLVGTVVLVQLCSGAGAAEPGVNEASAAEIATLVTRINARFGTPARPAVHLEVRTAPVPLNERLALWAATDVMLNTAIRASGARARARACLQVADTPPPSSFPQATG